jgi:hypothetical protein
MYIFGDIKNFIKRTWCKIYGHSDVVIVERYSSAIREKNFSGYRLKKLVMSPTYKEVITHGKLKCKNCGTVYIGNIIVKDKRFHDEPYNTP